MYPASRNKGLHCKVMVPRQIGGGRDLFGSELILIHVEVTGRSPWAEAEGGSSHIRGGGGEGGPDMNV